ncbi:DUF2975 domain-containing protein [Marinifilum sp. JC120]|nr:DUF2975 domain-containing protein [Marinifilum sp. JC120]
MDKIRKMSIFLKYVFWLLLISIPVFEVAGWLFFDGYDSWLVPEVMFDFEDEVFPVVMTQTTRILGVVVTLPQVLLDMFCMWQMVKLFSLYEAGNIFTAENSACYRRAAWAFLICEVINPFVQAGTSYVISMNNEVGERFVTVGIDDANIGTIIVACVILAISWVMDEGRKLQDEAELTI